MLFKCLRSGNTVNIDDPEDIERMKSHEGYIPVQSKENDHGLWQKTPLPEDAEAHPGQDAQTEVKKRGRPKK